MKTMNNNFNIDFSQYHFNRNPGIYTYRLHKKLKTKNGNISIFVQSENGDKHQITLFPDSHFLGIEKIDVGSDIRVEFVMSKNGKVYAKNITQEE